MPALSKTRLLDVWRFTVCNLWMGVNLECILYLVQHQGETDCHFPFLAFRAVTPPKAHQGIEKREDSFHRTCGPPSWARSSQIRNKTKKKPARFLLQGDAVWVSGGHTTILPAAIKKESR